MPTKEQSDILALLPICARADGMSPQDWAATKLVDAVRYHPAYHAEIRRRKQIAVAAERSQREIERAQAKVQREIERAWKREKSYRGGPYRHPMDQIEPFTITNPKWDRP